MNINYYPKTTTPTSYATVKIDKVLQSIKTGAGVKSIIERIRIITSNGELTPNLRSEVNNIKKNELPGVSFAGTFKGRYNDALIEPSGFMCLDFDKTLEVPEELQKHAYATFLSPGGQGVKVLIRIPLVKDDAQYKRYFLAIERKFPTIDKSGKDISRLTYLSYDPEIKIFESAPLWTEMAELAAPVTISAAPALSQKVHTVQSNYAKMIIAMKMIQQAPVGNRHETILKAGKLVGGYIGGGELIESDVIAIFENEVRKIMDVETDFPAQWKTFKDGVAYGKALPLKDRERERKSTKAEFKAEEVYGDIYYSAMDVEAALDDLYENGYTRGLTTGYPKFDEYFSIMPGYFTIIYGDPFTGKTALELSMLVNTSVLHGKQHCIFSPETGNAKDVFAKLIQIHAKGDITDTYKNRMSREQYETSKNWVTQHFIVIDGESTGVDFTMEDILKYVALIESKIGWKFFTVTIDPLIELKFDGAIRDDVYWNINLKIARVEAKINQWHIFLITHTINQKRIGQDEFGNAIMPIPTPRDIAGGQTAYRKGFQILCCYRHLLTRDQADSVILKPLGNKEVMWNSLFVRIQKSKPEGVGKMGEVEFLYDPKKHTYEDPMGGRVRPVESANKTEKPVYEARLPYGDDADEDTVPWDND